MTPWTTSSKEKEKEDHWSGRQGWKGNPWQKDRTKDKNKEKGDHKKGTAREKSKVVYTSHPV